MKPETFRKLAAAGLSHEQMALVLEIIDEQERAHAEADEARKLVARDRVNRWRERQKTDVTLQKVSEAQRNGLRAGDARGDVKQINSETPNRNISSLRSENISIDREFETEFWPNYPRKVGKGQALKAYRAARKKFDCDVICSGAARYSSERRGADQNFTKHPTTWLNGQCWTDEPAPPPSVRPPPHAPPPRERTILDVLNERIERADNERLQPATIDGEYQTGPRPSADLRFLADASRRRG